VVKLIEDAMRQQVTAFARQPRYLREVAAASGEKSWVRPPTLAPDVEQQ
jgi:hypothetical protein